MSTTSGSQPMTLRPSWRSISETWAVQVVDAVDHVVAGAVVAAVVHLVLAGTRPPGRLVEEGLTSHLCLCPTWTTQRPSQPWPKPRLLSLRPTGAPMSTSTTRLACSWILQQSEMMEKTVINYGTQLED